MTQAELLQYYADLLIIQYKAKPKAISTIKLLVNQSLCDGLLQQEQTCFLLDDSTTNPPQFTNLLINGGFETWLAGTSVAPTAWSLSGGGASVAREATIIKESLFSAKITRVGATATLSMLLPNYTPYVENLMTLGYWVYATVANRARISLNDGIGTSFSSYHTGSSTWEFLTVTRTINSAATKIQPSCIVDTGNTVAYFDGGLMLQGPTVPTIDNTSPNAVALGAQLNILGNIVGVPRNIYGLDLSHTFFEYTNYSSSPSTSGFGRYTSVPYPSPLFRRYLIAASYVLTEFELRTLIYLKIIFNTRYSSYKNILEAIYSIFGLGITLVDNKNMSITYTVQNPYHNMMIAANYLNILPRPMGVSATVVNV